MVTRNAFLLTRHKRARHEAKTTTPEVSTCNLCNKKFASAALCKEHMSQCQASQVDVFFNFNLLVCLQGSAYAFVPQFFWQVANCTTCAGACNCQSESSSQSRGRLRSANLSDAMETCSLAPTSFVCDHCRKVFANAKNLARHIEKYQSPINLSSLYLDLFWDLLLGRYSWWMLLWPWIHTNWPVHIYSRRSISILPRSIEYETQWMCSREIQVN